MTSHFDLNDESFEQALKTCSLDPALFSHEAHLRFAWLQISKYGMEKAIDNITTILPAYVASLGAVGKYNLTVTIAAIKAVDHFMKRSAASNFRDFIQENPRLKYNFRELLGYHYSENIFTSEKAKTEYVAPDLIHFDS
ncbi:MAG TPA: hypothetical protein VGD33_00345 [Chitinophagaceae bacterium]